MALELAKTLMIFEGDYSCFDNAVAPALVKLEQLVTPSIFENYKANPSCLGNKVKLCHAWLICYYVCFTAKTIKKGVVTFDSRSYGDGSYSPAGEEEIETRMQKYLKEAKDTLGIYLVSNSTNESNIGIVMEMYNLE